MTIVTSSLVRALRNRTGAGVIDCKKALIKSQGNIELAIEDMRKLNVIKAAKKAENPTTNGVIKIKVGGQCGAILEINCQTDFIINNNDFQKFSDKILTVLINEKITNIDIVKTYFEDERISLISKIGENINIRRISVIEGDVINGYVHNTRIGVLVAGKNINTNLIRQIAMHIAATKPEFIYPEDIPFEVIQKEYQIQMDIAMRSGKNKDTIKKIVEGRMKKFSEKISLMKQNFIINPCETIYQILEKNNSSITNFIRFEIGENIN